MFSLVTLISTLLLVCLTGLSTCEKLEWGTYRPGVYFGLRAKHPRSPLIGLVWYDSGRVAGLEKVRHDCSDYDELPTYGWQRHNGKDYGFQIIYDQMVNIQYSISWIRFPYKDSGKDGWVAQIEGYYSQRAPPVASGVVSPIWYIMSGEHANSTVEHPTLRLRDPSILNKKYAQQQFIQILGEVPSKPHPLPGDQSGNAADTDVEMDETFTVVQILSDDASWGGVMRPTKKGKMKPTVMDMRTYISAVTVAETNKWKSGNIVQQMLHQQYGKLEKRAKKIIEEERPETPEEHEAILQYFAPNLKHGFVGNVAGDTQTANSYYFQSFYFSPLKYYLVYLPDGSVTVDSWSDLPEHINSPEKIQDFTMAKSHEFDHDLQELMNVITVSDLNTSLTELQNKGKLSRKIDELSPEYKSAAAKVIGDKQLVNTTAYRTARAGLANMLGGIGYWHGRQKIQAPGVDRDSNDEFEWSEETTLVSGVPSRSFFPRGFYWDEGFHQLAIGLYDIDITMEIMQSWLNNMDGNGWIPREQIIGPEARSRVPKKFQIQKPHIANPPTLFLALHALYNRAQRSCIDVSATGDTVEVNDGQCAKDESAQSKVHDFLERNFDAIEKHFEWYIRTQTAPHNKDSFRWDGRTPEHNLPSGLDDYPRFENVTEKEGHVDLHCWMIKLYQVMSDFAQFLEKPVLSKKWKKRSAHLKSRLEELHWNEDKKAYNDYAIWTNPNTTETQKVFVYHIGYVSTFPLLLQIIDPKSHHFSHILDQISDPNGMWSDFGLRSLAKWDELYGKGEDYWRGKVWINLNYLAVKALHDYSAQLLADDPQSEIGLRTQHLYSELRLNIIRIITREFYRIGYFFENYSGNNGVGKGCKPFTGWTALLLNILAEIYP